MSTVAATSPPRVAIVTLGCGRNEVDSDQLAGLFHREGMPVVDRADDADVVLVNTCTFIAPAKQESIDTVLAACELKDERARAVLVVGCMAERYPDELAAEIPEADAIVGFDGYQRLPGIVTDLLTGKPVERVVKRDERPVHPLMPGGSGATRRASLPLLIAPTETPPEAGVGARGATTQDGLDRVPATGPRFPVRAFDGSRSWSYLKIASGCDRVCTFCAIPQFRGSFRSRPVDEVVAEAEWLVERGARELVLVSENTTSYGKDIGGRDQLLRLLERLGDVDGLCRARLMYLQPDELQRPLVEAIAELPWIASYFDLSLQHVSSRVLADMARSGSPERYGELIAHIREQAPDAVLRSNFIVGFPGETTEDVAALEEFLVARRLDWVGLFTFSAEDGTPAAHRRDQVDPDVAWERLQRLRDVQEHLADEAAASFVGRELEVIVDQVEPGAICVGRSYREAPETDGEVTLVTGDGDPADLPVGRVVSARVTGASGVDLTAVPR